MHVIRVRNEGRNESTDRKHLCEQDIVVLERLPSSLGEEMPARPSCRSARQCRKIFRIRVVENSRLFGKRVDIRSFDTAAVALQMIYALAIQDYHYDIHCLLRSTVLFRCDGRVRSVATE